MSMQPELSIENLEISTIKKVTPSKSPITNAIKSNMKHKQKAKETASKAVKNLPAKDCPFQKFAYKNEVVPDRDAIILREIEMHRQAVKT